MLDRLAGAEEYLRNFGAPTGEDAGVINQMADYAFLRGARCVGTALTLSTRANTRRICESTVKIRKLAAGVSPRAVAAAELVAEVEKPAGAANVATVRALLSGANAADPNTEDAAGRPLLILAARNGHAQIVSVLVTAGANVNATDPGVGRPALTGWDVAHYAASRPGAFGIPGSRAGRASVLYHFGAALDARNEMFADAAFDWNRDSSAVGGGFPVSMLDRLAGAEEYLRNFGAPAGEDAGVINQMADYAFLRGARCVGIALTLSTHANTRRICESTVRVRRTAARAAAEAALLAEVEKPAGAANVATVRALLSNADDVVLIDPNIKDSAGRSPLILAARNGHAQIVSVLVTAGADVNATDPTYSDYDAARHAAAPLTGPAAGPRALRASVLYYFGGGLDVRNAAFGDANFDWNREDDGGRRLPDLLALAEDQSPRPAGENEDVIYQMADYLLVRGARCGDQTADRTRRVCAGIDECATGARNSAMECACAVAGKILVGGECQCPAGEGLIGGVCVPDGIAVGVQKCADARREWSVDDGGACAAAITLSGGTLYSRCHFSGEFKPQCEEVFGAGFDFPDASAAGPHIYNCDPAGGKRTASGDDQHRCRDGMRLPGRTKRR